MTPLIRPYHAADLTALYQICRQTGAYGNDATAQFDDPDLMGHYFVAPYAVLQPDLCFVLTADAHPIGYVVAARNTADFHAHCETDWFPPLRARYPRQPAQTGKRDSELIDLIHAGVDISADKPAYPAHLHINILPSGQRRGSGRQLIDHLLAQLRTLEVTGVQLEVAHQNERAVRFYEQIGFELLETYPAACAFGRKL